MIKWLSSSLCIWFVNDSAEVTQLRYPLGYIEELPNKYFKFKKPVGRQGTPELKLLAVVIVLFAPILHETLTNSTFDTNTICQLSHGSSFKCHKLKLISQQSVYICIRTYEAIRLPKLKTI